MRQDVMADFASRRCGNAVSKTADGEVQTCETQNRRFQERSIFAGGQRGRRYPM